MGDVNHEPSMEEILASIKRVIAEDGRAGLVKGNHRRPSEPPPPAPDDVLELSEPMGEEPSLVSPGTAEASRQALAALAALNGAAPVANGAGAGDGPLEAVVREMLRPMLKQWLDERLPMMVEDLVTREIARITGKSL